MSGNKGNDAKDPRNRYGWRDDPIQSAQQDELGRGGFAKHAAELIDANHTASSSVVYGLEGAWGSGKSSAIALIAAVLTELDRGWRIVSFTPWATSGTEALIEEFFSSLSTAIPKTEAARRTRHRLETYAQIARPALAAVPIVGAGLAEASRSLESQLRKPWSAAFAEAAEEIQNLQIPILVVVDDIDRLQPEELLDLLKVVRLVGRFPGVDFLLAYDEQTLVETLQHPSRGEVTAARARAFMEKIVQYPLSMPPLLIGKIVSLLNEGLTRIVTEDRVESTFDKHRFGPVILDVMPSQLQTPRAIERFLAQVEQQFEVHDLEEVNDVDLILATFVRVQFPELFASFQRWKSELTRGESGWISFPDRNQKETDWDRLLNTVEHGPSRDDARATLAAIFPAVAEKRPHRVAARRFAHPDYFDRYLAQAIPEGDVPDAVITQALVSASHGDVGDLRSLLVGEDDERVTLALSKVRDRYPDITEKWRQRDATQAPLTAELLASVMTLVDEVPDRMKRWTSELSEVSYLAANITRALLDLNNSTDLVAAFQTAKNLDRRAYVLRNCLHFLQDLDEDTQVAVRQLLDIEAKLILDALIVDLGERDHPTGVTGNGLLFSIVDEAGLMPEAKKAVQAGLAAAEFTIEDVAARFVGLMYTVGGSTTVPSAASFDGHLFSKLTGVPAETLEHSERGEWPDASWPRRRAFAMKYVHPDGRTGSATRDDMEDSDVS